MATVDQNIAENRALIQKLLAQTQPLRDQTTRTLSSVLSGAPASSLPAYAPNRAALEGQYNQAKTAILGRTPRGGALFKQLADLEGKRAGAVTGLESDVRNNAMNQALQIGYQGLPSLLSAEANTSNQLANSQRFQWEMDQAKKNVERQNIAGLAQGGGALLGLLAGWLR